MLPVLGSTSNTKEPEQVSAPGAMMSGDRHGWTKRYVVPHRSNTNNIDFEEWSGRKSQTKQNKKEKPEMNKGRDLDIKTAACFFCVNVSSVLFYLFFSVAFLLRPCEFNASFLEEMIPLFHSGLIIT